MSNADELRKLKELLDSGALSQIEFEKEKKRLLDDESVNNKPIENISSDSSVNKDTKKGKIKKSYIVIGIFVFFGLIGSIGGDSSNENISTTSSNSSSNSTSNSSSNSSSNSCNTWASQSAINAGRMADIMDDVAINSGDAGNGYISFSTFESLLKTDLQKTKNIRNNQLSLTPNSDNRSSHNYFIDALDSLIDGIDFAILGVQNNDADYIELGIIFIEDAGTYASLASSVLSSC